LAQDDYYYEIQLTNKQLVFYFMAGAAGLILSFLAGVMVGRGVEPTGGGPEQARAVTEEKVVPEQPQAGPSAAASPSGYSYPQRLESDRPEEGLERPRVGQGAAGTTPAAAPVKPGAAKAPPAVTSPPPSTGAKAVAATPPAAAVTKQTSPTTVPKSGPPPSATPVPPAPAGLPKALASSSKGFAVQVVALKDRTSADSVVGQLKGRGLPAYVVAPAPRSGGLFTVRVGVYQDRADAEVVVERLRDDKFKPYIVKQ
jgi:cell division septation protein DedD